MKIEKALYTKPEQIASFIAAVNGWDKDKALAWMKSFFDPEKMIILTDEDDKIEIAMQFIEITFTLQNQKYKAFFLHPFYFEEATSSQTLDEFFKEMEELAGKQAFLLISDSPEMKKRLDLQDIDHLLTGTFDSSTPIPGNPKLVEPYKEQDYLYSIYQQFMNNFDGSIVLDREEFDNWLQYVIASGYDILVSRNRTGLPNGFAILSSYRDKATLLIAIYSQIEALFNLLSHLQDFYDGVKISVSEAESLDQLFPIELSSVVNLYGKLLHPELAARMDLPGENLVDILDNLEENHWNNLLV